MRNFPDLQHKEFTVFKKLKSPKRIQDFLDAIPINFETGGETCRSPLMTLKHNEAHCMEGAMLAAAALWRHGERPLLLDLKSADNDDDHVVTLFRYKDHWGAISKTNHAVLRWRDPIYKTVRELTMSYFNEYFLDSGQKTLRSFSAPFNLLRYGKNWLATEENLWHIAADLDDSPHFNIMENGATRRLRRADPLEIEAGKLTQWRK